MNNLIQDFSNLRWSQINLNHEAELWLVENRNEELGNPLLNPISCQEFVSFCHRKYNVDCSFGGYLEDRSTLWKGSYLDQGQKYFHLGIDINVPAGAGVILPVDAEVVLIDDERDLHGGWGPRMFLRMQAPRFKGYLVVLAHLQNIEWKVGDRVQARQKLAEIGSAPDNGNWFPHLHVQMIEEEYFANLLNRHLLLEEFDGYCSEKEIEKAKKLFPDPKKFFSL